jgi:hypothetical protein
MQAATIFVEVAGPALRAGDTGFCDARQKIIPLVGCCPVSVSSVSEIATDDQINGSRIRRASPHLCPMNVQPIIKRRRGKHGKRRAIDPQ